MSTHCQTDMRYVDAMTDVGASVVNQVALGLTWSKLVNVHGAAEPSVGVRNCWASCGLSINTSW